MNKMDQLVGWFKERVDINNIDEDHLRFVMKEYASNSLDAKKESDDKEKKLLETVFFVKANSFESHQLWKDLILEYSNSAWEQDNFGFSKIIGYLDEEKKEMPVNVSFIFHFIFGHRVCFYNPCSRYVDHEMIENWIKKNYSLRYDGDRFAMTDANNFHQVINYCKNLF